MDSPLNRNPYLLLTFLALSSCGKIENRAVKEYIRNPTEFENSFLNNKIVLSGELKEAIKDPQVKSLYENYFSRFDKKEDIVNHYQDDSEAGKKIISVFACNLSHTSCAEFQFFQTPSMIILKNVVLPDSVHY
jgi:hypothetical protein